MRSSGLGVVEAVQRIDIAVAGLGPAGLITAVTLARLGFSVAAAGLVAPAGALDGRTSALFAGSVQLLENIGAWDRCSASSAPLVGIRIVDATGRLLRAPEILFLASELGLPAFGYNVPNSVLTRALAERAGEIAGLTVLHTKGIERIEPSAEDVTLTMAERQVLKGSLLAGADGRNSPSRTAAGIGAVQWRYPQTALACNLKHSRPHEGISTEFHGVNGPFTVVPLPGPASSLVWVDAPDVIEQALAMDPDTFALTIENRLMGLLGAVKLDGKRAAFPLAGMRASPLAARRIALVGEAARVIPPIGAQGLNLGFRDAAALADAVIEAKARGHDIGGCDVLVDYDTARRSDVWSRTAAVDLLNRSLLSPFIPAQALRGLGLHLLGAIAPLRRLVMREGMGSRAALPRLMQPHCGGLPMPY